MSDKSTLIRQWTLLQKLPPHPRTISVGELVAHLEREGFGGELTRAVQRDLNALSEQFPLRREERGTASLWSWHGKRLNINGMTPSTALALVVARETLEHQLPHSTLEELQPLLEAADSLLQQHAGSGQRLTSWRRKVVSAPRGPELTPPKHRPEVVKTVEQALLDDHVIEMTYQRRDGVTRDYTLHPLGIAHREGVAYLIARAEDGSDLKDPRSYAMHRILTASDRYERCRRPRDFHLAEYAASKLGFPITEKTLKLKLAFDSGVAQHLIERPLGDDQQVKSMEDGRTQIRATVADTLELRWWLHGFADKVEVLGPAKLRRGFAAEVERTADLYRKED
ncbi:MAG: helix-turn-helix transcriptional regulator [Pseudomonadota bacterium]